MSLALIPLAYKEITFSSMLETSIQYLGTILGLNSLSRSLKIVVLNFFPLSTSFG